MKGKNLKKGVTLAELAVVMAVIAIISTMVISFSVACNLWARYGVNHNDTMSSCRLVKSIFRNFADGFDDEDHEFIVNGDKLEVYKKKADEPLCSLSFNQNALVETTSSGEIVYATNNITGIDFSVVKSKTSGNAIAKCVISYAVPPLNENGSPETGAYEILFALRVAGARTAAGGES